MKKLILLLILGLGYIYEGKAQIAPSTEIYYYVDVKKNIDSNVFRLCMFETSSKCICNAEYGIDEESDLLKAEKKLRNYRNSEFQFIWIYNPSQSSSKYYTYNYYKSRNQEGLSFSKDKESLIEWHGNNPNRFYFKRITREDLLNMIGPNLDFLE
ncbi:MAG: hypothetical protein IKJ10_03560 [Bacteroidaceae bacterium]|nr:hypothetical protein [Bacteroidaceae bacterium]